MVGDRRSGGPFPGEIRIVWEQEAFVGHLLKAIKGHAPRVVASLRSLADRCDPAVEPVTIRSVLRDWMEDEELGEATPDGLAASGILRDHLWPWAQGHNLVRPIEQLRRICWDDTDRTGLDPESRYHRMLILSVYETLVAWRDRPGRRPASAWREPDPGKLSFEELLGCQGMDTQEAMEAGDTPPELATEPDEADGIAYRIAFRCPGWDPLRETRATARERIVGHLLRLLDTKLDEAERLTGEVSPEDAVLAPSSYEPLHFKWLVQFQVLGWDKAEVHRRHRTEAGDCVRTAVYRGIDSAARYLVGPRFRTWLRRSPPGRRRNENTAGG